MATPLTSVCPGTGAASPSVAATKALVSDCYQIAQCGHTAATAAVATGTLRGGACPLP